MNYDLIKSFARQTGTLLGAALAKDLVTKFDFTNDMAQKTVGAVLILGSVAWSYLEHREQKPTP